MNIPTTIRKPGAYAEVDTTGASNSLPSNRQELLIVAPRLATGTVAKDIPTRVYSGDEAATYWGRGSIMHRMVKAAYEQYPYAIVTGIGIDDSGSGVAATQTVTFTGPATAAGTVRLWIGNQSVSIAVASADTATVIAQNLDAEIDKYPDLPFTASNATGVLTLTAKNKGTVGNFIGRWNGSSAYLSVAEIACTGVAATVAAGTAGSTDPTLTAALAAAAGKRYHHYALAWNDATMLAALKTHLQTISNEIQQRPARLYVGHNGSYSAATTLAATNYERTHIGLVSFAKTPSYEIAAKYAALQASEPHAAKILNNRELVGVDAPEVTNRLTWQQVNDLLWAGVTPFEVGSGETVRCIRSITTYITNAAGSPDPLWLDSNTIGIVDYLREAIKERHLRDFSNSLLKDEHADGDPDFMVTPADVNSTNLDVCIRLEKDGYLENVVALKDRFTCVRSANDRTRVDCSIPADVVNGLHVLASTIKVIL